MCVNNCDERAACYGVYMRKQSTFPRLVTGVDAGSDKGAKALRGGKGVKSKARAEEDLAEGAQLVSAEAVQGVDAASLSGGEAFATFLQQAADASGGSAGDAASAGVAPASGGGGVSPALIVVGLGALGGIAAVAAGGGSGGNNGGSGGNGGGTTPANSAPVFPAATQAVTTDEDAAKVITLAATDANSDTLTYTAATPANGTVVVSGSTVTYTPRANYSGADSFVVTASDGKGGTATQTINVTVTAVNDAPAFAATTQAVTTDEDVAKVIALAATDADGDTLTYTAAAPSNGTVAVSGSTVTYTPAVNYNGADSFVVTASDGKGGTVTQTINVTVAAVNDAPVISSNASRTITVTEDGSADFTISASDVEGAALTPSIVTAPAHGSVTVVGGRNVYTPNANYNGVDSFEVGVSDGALTTKYTVAVTVTPVNDSPTFGAASQSVTTDEDVAKVITLAATDGEGSTVTYAAGAASRGTVSVSGSTVTYTPSANFNGTDSFVVTASDGQGGTATQTINVTVNAVADSIDVTDDTVATTYTALAGVADKFSDNSALKTNAVITGMANGDVVEVSGASSDYSFTSVGNDIFVSYNNTAAGVVNQIKLVGLAASGGIITDETSAEAVAGFNFFNALTQPSGNGSGDGVAGANGNLDDDNDANPVTMATIAATSGADAYTESATTANSATITGFGAGDTITVSGAATSAYSFTSQGTDIKITYNNAGVVNEIVLANVVSSGTFIGSELDAETALGRDFFKDASSGTTGSNSLDVGTSTTRVTVSGATGAVTFTDNATVASNVRISNFGIDDLIRVTGATADQYSFSSGDMDNDGSADDLSIVYNAGSGVINDIQILNVVSPSDFVFDKNSAVLAVGFNFVTFG